MVGKEKDTNGRMKLLSLATHAWHFDGSYGNFTLIGPIMISASLLQLFTLTELLFAQRQERSEIRLLCEQGLVMCKDYKNRQMFYQPSTTWKFRKFRRFCWLTGECQCCSVSGALWFLQLCSHSCLQQRPVSVQYFIC